MIRLRKLANGSFIAEEFFPSEDNEDGIEKWVELWTVEDEDVLMDQLEYSFALVTAYNIYKKGLVE